VYLITLHSAQKSWGAWSLFRDVALEVEENARIGLIGPNGVGKTTLLRILAGLESIDAGRVSRSRGSVAAYLPQQVAGDGRDSVRTVLEARPEVAEIDAALRAAERELSQPAVAADLKRMSTILGRQEELLERWVAVGGAGLDGEIRSLLRGLGLATGSLGRPTGELSGGERKLVALAACLIRHPNVLLLDEPESHLDRPHREDLERLIQGFPGAVVIVSHDRHLLDETVNQIAELDRGTLTMWPGNYSMYTVERELALKRQQQAYVTQQKEIARLEDAIRRFRQWFAIGGDHRNIVRARNKQRQIDRMEKIDKPVFERRRMALKLRPKVRGGQKVVELRNVAVAFDGDPAVLDVNLTVFRGERVGVIGPNAAGKTGLGMVLAGLMEPALGERWAGPSIHVGYLGQEPPSRPPDATPLDLVRAAQPLFEQQAVNILGRHLFRYDQMRGPLADLSGGERIRLELLLLSLSGANCLILDEPTNHLDIESLEVLEGELERFDGTVVVISHDRYFLDRIPDRILEVGDGGVRAYPGGYSEWLDRASIADMNTDPQATRLS
jgi:ATP-binding cassette subfamily F protein 3